MDACDPGSESVNIRRLVKLHTGKSVSISRDTACEILKLAKRGNSPLPPLSITRDKKYLLDANLLYLKRIMRLYSVPTSS